MSRVAVELRGIRKVYGQEGRAGAVVALDGVDLEIRANEFFTLLGPSGCGKTTLLRLVAGFEAPTAGAVFLDGARIDGLPPYRREVNTVFQSYALFPHLTVARNVAFGLEMRRRPRAEVESAVAEALRLVRLDGFGDRRPQQLSGGQQQRVALARALANHPKVLLLDEPLSALDLKLRKEMQLELKRLQRETGITFVFVTHDQGEALTMSDRVAVMSDGRIEQLGAPVEIYERPVNRFVADFIGETNFLDAVLLDGGSGGGGGDGCVRFALDGGTGGGGGAELRAADARGRRPGERAVLAVRPERASLVPAQPGGGAAGLVGTVANVVYLGTDTTYRVAVPGRAEPFTVRVQNRDGAAARFGPGDPVAVSVPPEAVQVLRD